MCFPTPKVPEPKEPKLPQQPLARTQPAQLRVGSGRETDTAYQTYSASRGRSSLRIRRDSASAQVPGATAANKLSIR